MSALALSMTRAKTAVFYLTVTKYDGTVQPLVGATLYFHAYVGGVHIDKDSSSNGITITDSANGLATLEIASTDTTDITSSGIHIGSCELTLYSGGKPYLLNSGTLTVNANVSTP